MINNSCLTLTFTFLLLISSAHAHVLNQTHCLNKCGHVEIPYPFGTSKGCYLNSNFLMTCRSDTSGQPPRLFFGKSYTLEVVNLSLNGHLTVLTPVGKHCYYPNGSRVEAIPLTSLGTLPYFPFSTTFNKFFVVGCDTRATFGAWDGADRTGCVTNCGNKRFNDVVYDGTCSRVGCCQVTIPLNVLKSKVSVTSYGNYSGVWRHNRCSYVFVAERNYFLKFFQKDIGKLRNVKKVPTVLDWAVGYGTCESVQHAPDYACGKNSECVDSSNGPGYRCICSKGYEGNPYMSNGCRDIDECSVTPNPCGDNECKNTIGNYTCYPKDGHEGNGIRKGGCGRVLKILIDNIVVKLWKLNWLVWS